MPPTIQFIMNKIKLSALSCKTNLKSINSQKTIVKPNIASNLHSTHPKLPAPITLNIPILKRIQMLNLSFKNMITIEIEQLDRLIANTTPSFISTRSNSIIGSVIIKSKETQKMILVNQINCGQRSMKKKVDPQLLEQIQEKDILIVV